MRLRTLTAANKLTLVALLVAATGFVVQMVAGVTNTPTIPPGLVAIVLPAGLIAFMPGRWVPLAGVAAGLFNVVALFAVRGGELAREVAERLVDLSPISGFLGGWATILGLIVAVFAGTTATVQNYRTQPLMTGRGASS